MEILLGIFEQLGVDSSIFLQFAIAMVVYLLGKFLLFSKMSMILQTRDNLTTNLVKESELLVLKAQEAADEYRDKVESTYKKNQEKLNEKKSALGEIEKEKLAVNEKEISQLISQTRQEHHGFLNSKKQELMDQVKSLSDELTTKFIK